jgi:F-type H+-transporting ATPase subunit alpha
MDDRTDNVRTDERETPLAGLLDATFEAVEDVRVQHAPGVELREVGTVTAVGEGIARVQGLPYAQSEELLQFRGGIRGMAFNLDPDAIGVILPDESGRLEAGDEVTRTGRAMRRWPGSWAP